MTASRTPEHPGQRVALSFPSASRCSAFYERLRRLVGLAAHDGRIAVLHIVHGLLAAITVLFEWQGLCGDCLLQQSIPHVPLVIQHIVHNAVMPFVASVPPAYALVIEQVGDALHSNALQVERKNPANDRRLRFVDHKLAVYQVEAVGRSAAVEFAGFHSLFIAPPHILRYGHALLLGDHAGERSKHFAVHRLGIKPLFLEIYTDIHSLKRPQRCQHFFGVSRKA